jgi:hypothetical protein
MPTVNIQNILYLDQLIQWAEQKQLNVVFNYLDSPSYLNIDNMTPAARQLVVDQYLNHPHLELQKLAQRVQRSRGSNGSRFMEYMKKLDSYRNEDFASTHPEIAIAMGYN